MAGIKGHGVLSACISLSFSRSEALTATAELPEDCRCYSQVRSRVALRQVQQLHCTCW